MYSTVFSTVALLSFIALANAQCGLRPLVTNYVLDDERIVGGNTSTRGDWPWQISLWRNGRHICGGSMINKEWVITAAHCVTGSSDVKVYRVQLGLHDQLISDTWTVASDVKQIIYHENYDANLIRNDIAVIQLSQPVTFTDYVMPVCFPTKSQTFENAPSFTTGWGATVYNGPATRYLMEVSTPILTDAQCQARYSSGMVQTSTQVCSGSNNQGACQGDSGGPIVVRDTSNPPKYTLVGLTSWGIRCGQGGVFTRVSAFLDWIEAKIGSSVPR